MSWDRDSIHRTAKGLLDSKRFQTPDEADQFLRGLVLQIDVGPGIEECPAAQAALATAVNAGRRAFLGGVFVRSETDPVLSDGWAEGRLLSTAVEQLGGHMSEDLDPAIPTIIISEPTRPLGTSLALRVTWRGWAGGVVTDAAGMLDGDAIALAGVVAGAIGVSEMFQNALGSVIAGRRDAGLSLWRPDLDWRDKNGCGPRLGWLPSSLWLLGLGHLGQAYAWGLGWLPFATPSELMLYLMDTDIITKGNDSTGLLLTEADRDRRKTRVVSHRLENDLGHRTTIVERRFDADTWPTDDEPVVALAGFDDPAPRRLHGGERAGLPRFGRVVDGGLGAGPVEYLGIRLYTFPSQLDPDEVFKTEDPSPRVLPEPYLREVERRTAAGEDAGDVTCGLLEVAGVTVAAAFVGAFAGALVIADLLRHLHGGPSIAVLSIDLRSPAYVDTADNTRPGDYVNPGSTSPRRASSGWTAPA